MADYNSSLPVSGIVNQGTSPWAISGTVRADILTSPVPVSGNALGVSGTAFNTVWVGVGSVRIAEQGVTFGVSGIVNQGTNPWVVSGTATIAGQSINISAGSIKLISTNGSVAVYGTVATSAGARDNIINSYTSGVDVAAGGSLIHTFVTTGSAYISRVLTGFSGKAKTLVALSGTSMTHKAVGFNSTATPNIQLDFGESNGILVVGGTGLSVILYNREASSAQDVYSTIIGYEVI